VDHHTAAPADQLSAQGHTDPPGAYEADPPGVDQADPPGAVQDELDRIETQLDDVASALDRIEARSYGCCEVCGAAIDDDLLAADPVRRLCPIHTGAHASPDAGVTFGTSQVLP
jgi:hypothetical protein